MSETAWGIPVSAETAVALQAALAAHDAGDPAPLDHIRRELFAALAKAEDDAWHADERMRSVAARAPGGLFATDAPTPPAVAASILAGEWGEVWVSPRDYDHLVKQAAKMHPPVSANLPGLAPDPAAVAALDAMLRRWTGTLAPGPWGWSASRA